MSASSRGANICELWDLSDVKTSLKMILFSERTLTLPSLVEVSMARIAFLDC
ncbi:MAG: hypothetical protein VYC70_02285 [Verrucomicrobiota bacterium]|nr:hypothetical protein [Verrucomicrobiota bacterium]